MKENKHFNLFEFHHTFVDDILLLYKGPFDKHILSVFSKYIEGIIRKYPKISRKVFGIFIELAQNIAHFSFEKVDIDENKPVGAGTLVIGELDSYYAFFSGNEVKNSDIISLLDKCEIINSLDRNNLRKYKREQFSMPRDENNSAHIGLIQVALTANNHLDIEVTPINNELSFFSITVKVEKR